MAMIRVPPGTIPREQPFDERKKLKDYYRQQEQGMALDKAIEGMKNSPITRDLYFQGNPGRFSRPLVPVVPEEQENLQKNKAKPEQIAFSERRPSGYWGKDPEWQKLSRYEKAAAMALLEADAKDGRPDITSARNALGAMINRADKEGQDLGDHVSRKIYQPTIEPVQYSRLQGIMKSPEFQAMTTLAEKRDRGEVDDWVQGATHFLAKPEVMLRLEAEDPQKYRSWRKWTGFDQGTGRYSNEVMADSSHVFLAPEGKHTADRSGLSIYGPGAELSPRDVPQAKAFAGPAAPQVPDDSQGGGSQWGLPNIAKLTTGYDKPVLGNMLGLNLGGTGKFTNPIPLQQVSISADSTPLPDQEEGLFGVPPPPPRTPPHLPVPAQLPGSRRKSFESFLSKSR